MTWERRAAGLLVATVCFAPLAIGSVRPPAVAVLCVLAAAAAWAQLAVLPPSDEPRPGVPAFVLLLLLPAVLSLLQCVPLPREWVVHLSPSLDAIHGSVTDVRLGERQGWSALALAPRDAALSAGRWLAAAFAGYAAWLAMRRDPEAQLPARATEAAFVGVLLVVFFQSITDLDRIYLLFPQTGRGLSRVQGPFNNSNHLAAFLLLMTPVMLGRAWSRGARGQRAGWLVAAALGWGVALATLSRAALLGLPLGALILLVTEHRRVRRSPARLRGLAVGLGLVAVFGLGLVVNLVAQGDVWRLLQPDLLLDVDDRRGLYLAALRVLRDYPLVGIGSGGFVDLHFQYAGAPQRFSLLQTHSVYLQLLLDFGVLAGGVALIGLLYRFARLGFGALRSGRLSTLERGMVAGGGVLLAQNLLGFSLLIPGVAVPAAVLFGSLEATGAGEPRVRLRRGTVLVLGAGLLLLSVLGAGWNQWEGRRATEAELRRTLAPRPVSPAQLEAALGLASRTPADPWHWHAIGVALLPDQPQAALPILNTAMQLDPHGPAPHWSTAEALRFLGARSQALLEYRVALEYSLREFDAIVDDFLAVYTDPAEQCRAAPRDPAQRRRYTFALARRGAGICARELLEGLHADLSWDLEVAELRAELLARAGDNAAAKAAAEAVIERVGSNLTAHTVLAWVARAGGEREEEERQWRAALDRAADNQRIRPLSELGRLLRADGDSDGLRALAAAEQAAAPLPKPLLALVLFLQSAAWELEGNAVEALKFARRAQALDGDSVTYRAAVDRLQPRP